MCIFDNDDKNSPLSSVSSVSSSSIGCLFPNSHALIKKQQ